MEVVALIIDAIARIAVPIFCTLFGVIIGRKTVVKINNTRLDNIEEQVQGLVKEFREQKQGLSDEDYDEMEQSVKELFSKPSMRWFR